MLYGVLIVNAACIQLRIFVVTALKQFGSRRYASAMLQDRII
jgi:hypothetical protein